MPTDNGDVTKIVQFLEDSKNIFSEVVTMKDELFTPKLHQSVSLAWDKVEKRIEKLINLLSDAQPDGYYQECLNRVGLAGDELSFKLTGFYDAKDLWGKFKVIRASIKKILWKKILKNLLEWVNVILSSLGFILSVFRFDLGPVSFIADPIREFKDALEAGINSKEILDELPPL